jgi:hypothetical protein
VHRSTADCSDRYRQHVRFKDTKRKGASYTALLLSFDTVAVEGAWSLEEESWLLRAIEELAERGKTDMST